MKKFKIFSLGDSRPFFFTISSGFPSALLIFSYKTSIICSVTLRDEAVKTEYTRTILILFSLVTMCLAGE